LTQLHLKVKINSHPSQKIKENSKYDFCYICKKYGHKTDDCEYNILGKKNKSKNNKKQSTKKENKTHNKKNSKSKEKSIANLEYEEYNSENEMTFEELRAVYDKEMDNIEKLEDDNTKKFQKIQENSCVSSVEKQSENKTVWTFDTGASEHITNDKKILKNFKEEDVVMRCANGSICKFNGIGTYEGNINGYDIKLENVLYSNEINKNLLSGIKLTKNGMKCNLKSRRDKVYLTMKLRNNNKRTVNIGTFIANDNNTIHIITKNKNYSDLTLDNISSDEYKEIDDQSKMLWHRRLGHFYHDDINKYLKLHNIKPVKCLDCKISKLKRKPHNRETPKATLPLEVIHSDVIGPLQRSYTNKRYILTFIDEFTRKSWIFLLESKAEIPKTIINFFIYLNNQFNHTIKFFRTDRGTEYFNKKVLSYCKENGIVKTSSPPYNPQNNGIAERFNYSLVSCAKTLLHWSKMSIDF